MSASSGNLSGRNLTILRKAQRIPALVSVRLHHVVEGDFQNDFRFDDQAEALIFDGVFQEPLSHLGDLDVGQAGIRFADVEQFFSIAHGEGVVAQHSDALAVAVLDRRDHHVERGQFALELEPRFAAPSGSVGRRGVLDHQAFVAAGLRGFKQLIEFLRR